MIPVCELGPPQVSHHLATHTAIEHPGLKPPPDLFHDLSPSHSNSTFSSSELEEDPLKNKPVDTSQPVSLSPKENSKEYLDSMMCMVTILSIQSVTEPVKVTDIMHRLVLAELPSATLLPMLPEHVDVLKEAWEHPASVKSYSKRHNAFYRVKKSSTKFLFSHFSPHSMIVHTSLKGLSNHRCLIETATR